MPNYERGWFIIQCKTSPTRINLDIEKDVCFDKRKEAVMTNVLVLVHHVSRSYHHVTADLGMLTLLFVIINNVFQIIYLV